MPRLSPLDAGFLYGEDSNTPMHVGGLHLYSYPEGADDDWLQTILDVTKGEHSAPQPPFNRKLKWPPLKLGLPSWVEDDEFDLDYHLRHSALPKPGRYRELFALISRLHSTLLHRDRPLWEAHVIEGLQSGRFAMYYKMHHAMIDGMSAMRLLQSTLSENPAERDMASPWARPRTRRAREAKVSQGTIQAVADQIQAQVGAIPGATRAITRYIDAARHPDRHALAAAYAAPRTALNGKISAARRFVAQSYSLRRIKAVGKSLNATVNDVVLAMSAGALREYLLNHAELPAEPLTAMAPVSVEPRNGAEIGNSVTMLLTSLATHIAEPTRRLRAIQQSVKEGKELLGSMTSDEIALFTMLGAGPAMLPMMLGLAGRVSPPFNVTISNVPGPKKRLYWNGATLEGMYPVSIPFHGFAVNITVTSYVDSLDFGIIACRRSVPSAQRMIDYLEQSLKELENRI